MVPCCSLSKVAFGWSSKIIVGPPVLVPWLPPPLILGNVLVILIKECIYFLNWIPIVIIRPVLVRYNYLIPLALNGHFVYAIEFPSKFINISG